MLKMNLDISPDLSVPKIEEEGFKRLTLAEKQVMRWVASGKTVKEISEILNITVKTAETHKTRILQTLAIHNIADITRIWMQLGPVDSEKFMGGGGI